MIIIYLWNSSYKPHKHQSKDLKRRLGPTAFSLITKSTSAERDPRLQGCFWSLQALLLLELHAGPFSKERGWTTLVGCSSWTERVSHLQEPWWTAERSGKTHLRPGSPWPFILWNNLRSLLPFDLMHTHSSRPITPSGDTHQRGRQVRSSEASQAQGEATFHPSVLVCSSLNTSARTEKQAYTKMLRPMK